ncbi:recombinase family protein [Enterococcus sp. DIV0840c]|uniref:recombinase family protein n=1 Tax=Enterococcus sp. DIV0840c TaxID=2774772 RepID=UPI003D2CE9D7
MRYGYIDGRKKETRSESIDSLRVFGVDILIVETHLLPKKSDSELSKLISLVTNEDVIIVESIEKMGCSIFYLTKTLDLLTMKGCAFISIKEKLDNRTPRGEAMIQMLQSISNIEQKQLAKKISSGIRTSEKKGTKLGRPRIAKERLSLAIELYESGHFNIRDIVAISKVSQGTIYKEVNRLKFLEIND